MPHGRFDYIDAARAMSQSARVDTLEPLRRGGLWRRQVGRARELGIDKTTMVRVGP